MREAAAARRPATSGGQTMYPTRRPGATVFENDDVKMTRPGSASSASPGSASPSKRSLP